MKNWRFIHFALLSCLLGLHFTTSASEGTPTPRIRTEIPYHPILSGIAIPELREKIEAEIDLFQLKNNPTHTVAELKARVKKDMQTALKILTNEGYYNAEVSYSLNLNLKPVVVNFMIQLGVRYTIQKFDLISTDPKNLVIKKASLSLSQFGASTGQPANMQRIRDALKDVFALLGNEGYPYAKVKTEKATADHTTRGLDISVEIDPGKLMKFNDINIISQPENLDTKFVLKYVQWHKGDVYSNIKVMQTVEELNNTQKFNYVKISRPPSEPQNGLLSLDIELIGAETKPVAWDIGFEGSQGISTSLAWKGTNIFGDGDFITVEGRVGQNYTGLYYAHILPDIIWAESELRNYVTLDRYKTTTYSELKAEISSILSTPIVGELTGEIGYAFSISNVRPSGIGKTHSPVLVSVPVGVTYESYDNPQNPRKGWDFTLRTTPYLDVSPNNFFWNATILQHVLWPLTSDNRLVLSGWYNIGVSPGVTLSNIPITKRFYAGGMKSVRGYGEQMAGPLDADGKPLGGRSVLTFGTELTYYVTEKLAAVGFMDAGSSYLSSYPSFGKKMFFSFGAGVRYKTIIGDAKLDIAIPGNRRPQDNKAHIYFTIGQPF